MKWSGKAAIGRNVDLLFFTAIKADSRRFMKRYQFQISFDLCFGRGLLLYAFIYKLICQFLVCPMVLIELFKCNNKIYLTLKLKAVSCKKNIIWNILHSFAWKLTIYLLIKMVSLKWTKVGVLIHNWFDWRLSFRDILEPPSHWIVSNLHICIVFLWL